MKTLFVVALILASLASVAIGQEKTDVDRLGEKIAEQLEPMLTGWRYERVGPFYPGSLIVVQTWGSTNRCVMVRVAIRETEEDGCGG